MATPQLYFLDIGQGGEVDTHHLATSGKVMTAAADGSHVRELVTNQPAPDGIDISASTGRMFWTNMGFPPHENNGSIMSADLEGQDVKTVIPSGEIHTPKQIIVDEDNQKLYMSDREGLRVHRCNFDGSQHEVLVQTGDHTKSTDVAEQTLWCVGIAIDNSKGHLYWTQKGPSKGGKGRIFRANINIPANETPQTRSDIEELFSDLPEPIDLEFSDGKLYWTDRGEYPLGNVLNVADVAEVVASGPQRPYKTLARHFHELIGLKIDHVNQHVYMTDLGGTVYRTNIDGSDKRKLYDTDNTFTGIGLAYL